MPTNRLKPITRAGVPAAATPAVGTTTDIAAQIAALQDLDIHDLRIRWRRQFRKAAPEHLPRYLLLRMIAYRIQARAFGDLDRETIRYLDEVARQWQARRAAGTGKSLKQAPPPVPPAPVARGLKPGTLLAREHESVLHRVMVVKDGFAWNGSTYRSLSEVARAITGTNWNGPRFFGLRDNRSPKRAPAPAAGPET